MKKELNSGLYSYCQNPYLFYGTRKDRFKALLLER